MFWRRKVRFTLLYWKDDGFFVGKLKEVPGVLSQGKTLKELRENIEDAFHLIMEDDDANEDLPVRDFEKEKLGIAI